MGKRKTRKGSVRPSSRMLPFDMAKQGAVLDAVQDILLDKNPFPIKMRRSAVLCFQDVNKAVQNG